MPLAAEPPEEEAAAVDERGDEDDPAESEAVAEKARRGRRDDSWPRRHTFLLSEVLAEFVELVLPTLAMFLGVSRLLVFRPVEGDIQMSS